MLLALVALALGATAGCGKEPDMGAMMNDDDVDLSSPPPDMARPPDLAPPRDLAQPPANDLAQPPLDVDAGELPDGLDVDALDTDALDVDGPNIDGIWPALDGGQCLATDSPCQSDAQCCSGSCAQGEFRVCLP